ncbi:MAG: DUF3048 domain-containing protein [Clostridiales Family XIII bacterium]|jgi:hypothetical protein|nr:DUF3048 domain-containing protein [Clostridiales Family XIII bacterium]
MVLSKRSKIAIIVVVAVAVAAIVLAFFLLGGKKEPKAEVPKPAKVAEEIAEEPVVEKTVYVSPFTGLPLEDTKNINRRPLSVKIENDPEAWYQMGLNSADIVYETRVEGNVSRFNCIFQSNIPDEVGPVRSARLSDAWVVPQYNGLLYFSGCNTEVRARLNSAEVTFGASGNLFHRVSFKRSPHNLYMDSKSAYSEAKKSKIDLEGDLKTLYYGFERTADGAIVTDSAIVPIVTDTAVGAASDSASAASGESGDEDSADSSSAKDDESATGAETSGTEDSASGAGPLPGFNGEPATTLSLSFMSKARWEWDADAGVWLRWTSDKKHLDGATEEQVYTDNIVVMYAEYPQAQKKDPAGSPTYNTVLGGEGKAMLLRDGYVYECTWEADEDTPPALFDKDGNQLPLKQGKTWFEVPPTSGMDVKVE